MVSRTTYSGGSTPPVSGVNMLAQYAERLDTLFDASALPLTAVAGTVNAVTATLDPALATAGVFVDGMKFSLTWGGANTAGVTLAINGGTPLSVLDSAGAALAAGAVATGLRSLIEYVGGSFRVLSPILDAAGSGSFYYSFTANGTFTKPTGLDDDRMILIEAWGGGGGGSSGTNGPGGGGGGYAARWMRAADVPSSVAITVGAGGAVNNAGVSTAVGSLLTAYPGGSTGASNGGGGGGGGGEIAAGSNGSTAAGGAGGAGGLANGGSGGKGGSDGPGTNGGNSFWGGGGGGGGATGATGSRNAGNGGSSVFGGAGGAGAGTSANGSAGQSLYGGAGGAVGSPGVAPAGGGGRNGAGARGEVRIWI